MPKSLVEVRRPYAPEAEVAIMDAVHDALVAAFAIPVEDRGVRFVEHPPHRFSAPDGLEHPDAYTLVTIDCFVGRSLDAKRRLYRELGSGWPPPASRLGTRASSCTRSPSRTGASCRVSLRATSTSASTSRCRRMPS